MRFLCETSGPALLRHSMPTKIRLQQHGVRNHPYWWIIVQGPNRNARGRLIEHMGFWIPRKCVTVDRAIILNRPRLKYWLAVGAQPSEGVAKVLQYAEFLPRKPPVWGAATLYPRVPKPLNPEEDPLVKRLGAFKDRAEEVRNSEEAIKAARRLYDENAGTWLSYSQKPLASDMLQAAAQKANDKRDINQLFEHYASLMSAFDKIVPNASNEQRFMLLNGLSADDDNYFTEVTISDMMSNLKITEQQANDLQEIYFAVKQGFTQSDLQDHQEDLKYKGFKSLTQGKAYIPSPNTMTPVPNFSDDELNELPKPLVNFSPSLRGEPEMERPRKPFVLSTLRKNRPGRRH